MQEMWNKIKDCLKENLSGAGYQTLISSTKPLSFNENIFSIEVPNTFSKEWIKDKCEPILRDKIEDVGFEIVFEYFG